MQVPVTRITGLELASRDGQIIFVPHEYIGKEPDTKFLYLILKKISEKLGVPLDAASFMCSDEENGLERMKRAFYLGKVFANDVVGPMVLSQPSHVANNIGHSSHLFLVTGHIGMYKNEEDGRLLYGKVESERDGVSRPTCGAIYHVINRFLGKEHGEEMDPWDVDLIGKLEEGLKPFKQEFLEAYNRGSDDLEKLSLGMRYLVLKNVDVQVERLLQLLSNSETDKPKLVVGGVTLNRYKYPDTTLLTHIYLLYKNTSYDLVKVPVPIQNATRHQAD